MSSFNKTPKVKTPRAVPQKVVGASPITSASKPVLVIPSDTRTANGAEGWTRDAKSELFLLAVTNMVGEDTFYEGASARDERFRNLVRQVAREDADWIRRFIPWLRTEANMRTASVVAAVEAAQATTGMRATVAAALSRPDEPGEALAYIKARGYKVSGGLQRGIADAALRMYTERNLLKYDTASHAFRFGDVIELVHPKAASDWQNDLFRYAITRRHNRPDLEIPASLKMLKARAELERVPVTQRRAFMAQGGTGEDTILGRAGMTWESLSGWLQGPMDAEAWEAIIPSMGYMALLRNLRNFDQAGVSDAVAIQVAAKLADHDQVARSRQLPMRFLSAYNAASGSLRWSWALEQALDASLVNVPRLKGRTLVLVDVSGSMNHGFSKDGSLRRWNAAALFGIALATRAESADVVAFGSNSKVFPLMKGEAVLQGLQRFKNGYFEGGGTATAAAVRAHFRGHDRVVILTDEQANGGYSYYGGGNVNESVPQDVPLYNFNLAGYAAGSTPAGFGTRHTFGGLSDSGFKMLALVDAGRTADWPF